MTIMAVTGGIVFVAGVDLVLFSCLFCLGALPLLAPLFYLAAGWSISYGTSMYIAVACFLGLVFAAVVSWLADLQVSLGAPVLVTLALISGLMAGPFVFQKLNPYQRKRITSFLQPEADPKGSGYNLIQSRIAIGSGGLTGKGLLRGSQNVLGFLPHKHTDFIFSVLGEEFGFVGVSALIGTLVFLLFRCIVISFSAADNFSMLVGVGITCMFTFHFLVNIGMTIGLMPITGLPLLMVSYGGSSLLTSMFCIGILTNISINSTNLT
jgi:rod shape determining protein RodA